MVTNGAKFSDGDGNGNGDVVSALCEVHTEKRQRFSCLLLFLLLLVAFGFWHNIFSIFVVVKTRVICTRVCVCECQCVCVCVCAISSFSHAPAAETHVSHLQLARNFAAKASQTTHTQSHTHKST